ncbi:MAG: GFA family protein [Deltaproteobacteria bacterium]|nr:GFA family protein [Deltaproteobacteria bacterium]
MTRTYHGSCHCGAVRFEVDLDLATDEVIDCDCSICTKKGIVHVIVPPARFRSLTPGAPLTCYRFGTRVAEHKFCAVCGMHPYYTPRSHPDHVDVNVRCLDDLDWRTLTIKRFGGRDWEANIEELRGARGDPSR